MSRQLADRKVLGFPPYRRILELTGAGSDIDAMLAELDEVEELLRDEDEDGQRAVAAYPISAGDRVGTREIGRASCRERVEISVGDGALKKETVRVCTQRVVQQR